MATRKRLSDLVREEVKKQSDDDASSSQTTPKKTKRQPAKGLKNAAAGKSATPAKKKVDASVATLKAKLAEFEKKNQALTDESAKLLSKVTTLETQISSFEQTEQALKAAQSKLKSMQLTLDEAKQDALKLAQENQKLLDQIKVLESEKSAAPQPTRTAPVKSAPPARIPPSRGIQRSPRTQPVIYKAPAKKPFSRPIAPPRMPPQRVVQNSDEFETWCYD